MHKPIYNRKGWVLGHCNVCNSVNYVEPHGMDAKCKKCKRSTDHHNIPYSERDRSGTVYLGAKKNPSVRTAPKSAIPSKFVSAKVRRVGGKVQILLNK